MYYAIILLLSVRRHGEHNELLAQVAKRAKRVQLLVYKIPAKLHQPVDFKLELIERKPLPFTFKRKGRRSGVLWPP